MTNYKLKTGAKLLEMAQKFLNDGNRRPEIKDANQLQLGSDAPERPPIKLIYEVVFTITLLVLWWFLKDIETNGPTVTLIYRGMTYERTLQLPKPYQESRTINWRYRHAFAGI